MIDDMKFWFARVLTEFLIGLVFIAVIGLIYGYVCWSGNRARRKRQRSQPIKHGDAS